MNQSFEMVPLLLQESSDISDLTSDDDDGEVSVSNAWVCACVCQTRNVQSFMCCHV